MVALLSKGCPLFSRELLAPWRGLPAAVPLGESGILHADLRPCGFHLEYRPFIGQESQMAVRQS